MKTVLFLTLALCSIQISAAPEEVLIPSGSFEMGDHHDLGGREHRNDELPIRSVFLKAFHMGKYEVTVAQYCEFLNDANVEVRQGLVYQDTDLLCDTRESSRYSRIAYNQGKFSVLNGKDPHPVTGIRWHGAAAYCDWLSVKEGLEPCYSGNWKYDFSKNGYRLPTEEEWEYAGRGGLHSPYRIFPWGDDDDPARANWPHSGDPFESGEEPFTTPVGFFNGSFYPEHDFQSLDGSNGYGLYDMAGNVWEWCNDTYSQSSADPDQGKPMPDGKIYHVLRSGNWYNGEWGHSRVSNRNPGYFRGPQDPDHPYYHIGLRVARNAPDAPLVAGDLKILGNDFEFTEGPAADAGGNVAFTDVRTSRIYVYSIDGDRKILRENTGGANGLYFDASGNLLACEGEAARVTSMSPDGRITVLADEYNGVGLNKPNDLWIDPIGGVYFTDPLYGRGEPRQDGEHVYYIYPDRSRIIRVIDDFTRPNGLIGTPDGKTLYVADAGAGKIWKYRIGLNGNLSNKTFFAEATSDGMTLDALGNVYATQESVLIFNPDGKLISEIKTPNRPTNVTFGGKARRTLFITARSHLCSVEMNVRGIDPVISTDTPRISVQSAPARPVSGGRQPQSRPDRPWLLEHAGELDMNGDGAVGREEMLIEAEKAFGLYDFNGDNQLTREELNGKGTARSPMGGFIKLHARELDSNGDGTIDRNEMLAESAMMFDKSDKNRDKKVDATDESLGNSRSNQPSRQGGGNRFAELDSNKDGKVSFSEYLAGERARKDNVDEARMRNRFSEIDTDSNGSLSNNELEAAPRGRGERQ